MCLFRWHPYFYLILTFFCCFQIISSQEEENELLFNITNTKIEIGNGQYVSLHTTKPLSKAVDISFNYQIGTEQTIKNHFRHNLIDELRNVTLIPTNGTSNVTLYIHAKSAGHVIIGVNNISNLQTKDAFISVTTEHSAILNVIIIIIGWIYFAAWSFSFYPQVFLNYTRKSVIGLNFDFIAYNITGFIAYSVFNIGMYWIPSVQKEYFESNPRGVNPVQLNDVIFALHATLITSVTIIQACIYEKGPQRVSFICKIIFSGMWLFSFIILILAFTDVLTWFKFVTYLSYVKLLVTLIKYIPQVLMNWRRQSTVGWSIWNVLLDFTGGFLSILQMFLLSYNNDDWDSIFGDPTKFGLGAFSIMFDLIFIIQHYVLYRETNYSRLPGNDSHEN